MKQRRWLMASIGVLCAVPALAQIAQPVAEMPAAFDPDYRAKARGVRILTEQEARKQKAPVALAQLANRKLALKVRDNAGQLAPFYVRGLGGVGYWKKVRPAAADYEKSFTDFGKLGANTALVGLHWRTIEPEDGKFDFTYTDMVVNVARKHGVKVWWVLFMHFQPDIWPEPGLDKFWVYHLDDRDGANYTVQWLKDPDGHIYNSIDKLLSLKPASEVFPAYGHPKVFPRILRMARTFGAHYRNSADVLGVQFGNEEGFNAYSGGKADLAKLWENDFNPFTQQFYERWKQQTGKSDWPAFKIELVKYYWSRFATAYHEGEPYKLISFNLLDGGSEAHDPWLIRSEGADSTLYGEGNIDVIGSMMYRRRGMQIWPNLDQHYNYVYRLPILIPSEIGMRAQDLQFQNNVISTLERGAQGLVIWAYRRGMVLDGGGLSEEGAKVQKLFSMMQGSEDLLYSGVPGPGDVSLEASGEAKVSELHSAAGTVGIIHFPGIYVSQEPPPATEKVELTVEIRARKAGTYVLRMWRDGKAEAPTTEALKENATRKVTVPDMLKTEALFLQVRKVK